MTDAAREAGRRVGAAAMIWSAAVLLSRVVGLVRDIVLGHALGVSAEGDVYYAAFVIPDFVNYLLAGGLLSLTFIPIFSRHLAAGDEARGWDSFSDIANFLVVVALPVTVLVGLATPWIAPLVGGGFDAHQQELLVRLTRILLPGQTFLMLGAMLSGTLQARDRHAVAAFAPATYTLGIIVVGLALHARLGAEAFAWGVLAGAALGAFAIPLVACLRAGMRWKLRLDLRNPDFRTYLGLALPVMVGQSIVALDSWIWKWQGTYAGEGAVSTLQYAKTLLNVPAGIFGMAAGAAAYPTLVRMHHERRVAESWELLTRTARTTVLLAVVSQALLMVAGEDAVRVVWAFSSRRFSPADVEAIARALALFAISLPAWSLHPVLSRGFYARGNTWLPTVIGTVVTVLVVPLYMLLRRFGGTEGLALASSLALIAYVVPLHVALRRQVRRELGPDAPPLAGWTGFLLRSAGALVASGFALWGVRTAVEAVLPGTTFLPSLARLAAVALAAVPAFLVCARTLGIGEAGEFSAKIRSGLDRVASRLRGR